MKKGGFPFEVGPNIDVVGVATLSPPTGRHTHRNSCARYQHIQNAIRIYFLLLQKRWCHQMEQGTVRREWEGQDAHQQVPSPSLKTSLMSYKYYICIALKKQIHRTATGRPHNHTNKNGLTRFNTEDIKGSGSALPSCLPRMALVLLLASILRGSRLMGPLLITKHSSHPAQIQTKLP